MRSQLLSVLLGGCLTLAGTILGVLITHWLHSRDRREQRAFDEALRRREWQLQELRLMSQGDDVGSKIAADMVREGGIILPPHQRLGRFEISSEDMRAFCIPRDTMITMSDDGLKAVQELMAGDVIRTYDARSHTVGDEAVENVVKGESDSLIVINSLIRITPAQQIFCDGRYRSSESLGLGQRLPTEEFRQAVVTSLERVQRQEQVFSVLLESGNGFFVRGVMADYSIIIREGRTGKTSDSHESTCEFLHQAAGGNLPGEKKMIFNPETGKFEVSSESTHG